jgi:hypothetical protein
MPNPGLRLKEPAIAGYTYNPSKPPFEKGGFVVSLSAYLTAGEYYPQCHNFVLHDTYGTLCKN